MKRLLSKQHPFVKTLENCHFCHLRRHAGKKNIKEKKTSNRIAEGSEIRFLASHLLT